MVNAVRLVLSPLAGKQSGDQRDSQLKPSSVRTLGKDQAPPCWHDLAMAAAVPAPAALGGDLGGPTELFRQDGSPSGALRSLLAMCWFWPPGSEAGRRDVFLGSALLSLGRLVKDKLARAAAHADDCLQALCCRDDGKGDIAAVTMGSASSADVGRVFFPVYDMTFLVGKNLEKSRFKFNFSAMQVCAKFGPVATCS